MKLLFKPGQSSSFFILRLYIFECEITIEFPPTQRLLCDSQGESTLWATKYPFDLNNSSDQGPIPYHKREHAQAKRVGDGLDYIIR